MCVQSKLVWEVSRYRSGGLAGGWWCGVTWSVRTCVGSVEGPELFETGACFDSFPSLARRNRSWRIIRENRLNKLTKLVKIDQIGYARRTFFHNVILASLALAIIVLLFFCLNAGWVGVRSPVCRSRALFLAF